MTLLPLQGLALAQTTLGRLVVTVKDARGDVVPGATVRVVNEGTQTEDSGVTEEGGIFNMAQIPVGTYTVTVDAQGFSTKVTQGVKVDVGQEYGLVVELAAGGVGETVTVVAGEELVKTTQTDITTTVSQKQVQDLPLDGRNPLNLVNLQAGTNYNGRSNTAINGQRVSSVEVTQDGINIQDNFIRSGGFEVTTTRTTVASVAEFSVTTSNAQVDSAGASDVRLVTPSGTSDLHGEVFEYHRNDALGANDFFNNAATPGIERPKLIRNQFGFRLSGPVYVPKLYEQKDKLFFFGFYEGQRTRTGVPFDSLVLTQPARSGIFQYFDNSGHLRSINVLQAGGFQLDPLISSAVLPLIPTTINNNDFGDGLNTGGYSFNKSERFDRNQGGARIDYQLNTRHHFEAIYNYTGELNSRDDVDFTFRETPGAVQTVSNHFGVFAWNWTITDRLVNEVRVGTNQTFQVTSQDSGFVPNALNVRNFIIHRNSAYVADSWRVHPRVTLNLGVRWDYTTPLRERDNLVLLPVANGSETGRDIVLNPEGTLDFANGYYFNPDKNNFAPNIGVAWDVFGDGKTVVRGAYSVAYINDEAIRSFDNAASANSGLASTVSRTNLFGTLSGGTFNGAATPSAPDIFATVLQPGDFMVPRSYADNFALDAGAAAFTIDPNFQTPFYNQWNLSVEREVGWDTAVSLRYVGNRSTNLARGVDYNQLNVIANGFAADVARAQANGFLAQARNGTFDPRYNPNIPGSQQLTVFPMLASGGLLTNGTIQSYIQTGEAGTLAQIYYTNGLQGAVNFTANPNTFVADVVENLGTSDYHSFQAEVRRRFTSGFGFQANYTWSKTLTNASGLDQTKFEPPLDINNLNQTRTRAQYDIPHAFKFNGIYELPFGEGHRWADYENGFLKHAVSGWQVSSIITWQSGAPFSILSGRGTFNRVGRSGLNGANTTLTADEIKNLFGIFDTPNGIYFINPAVINPASLTGTSTQPGGTNADGEAPFAGQVFSNPGAGEIGSLQAYQFNGPSAFSWDAGIIKRTAITESANLEFRAEFFNVLNHPVFFVGNQNINDPNFGKITTPFSAPRVIQLALKVSF